MTLSRLANGTFVSPQGLRSVWIWNHPWNLLVDRGLLVATDGCDFYNVDAWQVHGVRSALQPLGQGEGNNPQFPIGGTARERHTWCRSGETPGPTV